jgi:7-cyano-7-deazaguanine synthase in queuosine biosynthesis
MLHTIQNEELHPQWHPITEMPLLDFVDINYSAVATFAGVSDITIFNYTHSCKEDPACGVCARCVARTGLGMVN